VLFKRAARPVWPDGPIAWHGLRKSHVGQAWADRSACQAARPGTIIRPGQDGPGPGQAGPPVWPSILTIDERRGTEQRDDDVLLLLFTASRLRKPMYPGLWVPLTTRTM
jgi:hypothetical protein